MATICKQFVLKAKINFDIMAQVVTIQISSGFYFLRTRTHLTWQCQQPILRSSRRRCSVRKGVLRNFAKFRGKHLCQSLFFNNKVAGTQAGNFIKKETLEQVFSHEFCKISMNTFFTEHLRATASEVLQHSLSLAFKDTI